VSETAAAARPGGRRRPPFVLGALASVTAAAAVLPVVYLLIRGLGADEETRAAIPPGTLVRLTLQTGLLTVGVVAVALAIGTTLAWLTVRSNLPWRRGWSVAATLPLVIPSYVAALALLGAFGPKGLLQEVLAPLGVERLPDVYGYGGALVALALSTFPYVYLIAAASLRSVDPSIEEAARSLGRSPRQVFFTVTLPAIRPGLAAASLLVALYVLADFGAVSLMQYPTLTRAVYLQYESLLDRSSAALVALVLVGLSAIVVWVEGRARGSAAVHRTSPGAGRRAQLVALERWKPVAVAFCTAVVTLFLLVPLGVLVWWATEGVRGGRFAGVAWGAAADTALVSAIAAACALLAVLPVAILGWARPSRGARLLERLTFVPNAVPGIAVALALVFFGVRIGGIFYQSLAMLIAAYVIRFMPQGLAATRSALVSVDPRLLDASRSLGRGPAPTYARVVLPLAQPGLLAGAALVFLSTMKELPATLLLRPIGLDTLATEIWTDTSLGDYSAAAPSALLLVAVATPFVLVLSSRRAWELGAAG
jgi:iron(III) transport system permease protein